MARVHAARFPSVAAQDPEGGRDIFLILSVEGKGVSGMLEADIPILALPRNAVSQGNEDFYGTRWLGRLLRRGRWEARELGEC